MSIIHGYVILTVAGTKWNDVLDSSRYGTAPVSSVITCEINKGVKERHWISDLEELGYVEQICVPINPAIQVTMAAITSKELHKVLQEYELNPPEGEEETGQPLSCLDTLGIQEWTSILVCFKRDGENAAINKLRDYISSLQHILDMDGRSQTLAKSEAKKISKALHLKDLDDVVNTSSSKVNAMRVRNNPLFSSCLDDPDFPESDKVKLLELLYESSSDEDTKCFPLVPNKPLRMVELEVSGLESQMWRIPGFTQLAPISCEMWITWANLTPDEVEQCKNDAINGNSSSELYILNPSWPMKKFQGKYKCSKPGEIRVKGDMITGFRREAKHDATLWNWHRPFMRSNCQNSPELCNGEFMWVDHAVWFIVNNLERFFEGANAQERYVAFVNFMGSTGRTPAMAQLAFFYIRQHMMRACLELFDNPKAKLLAEFGDAAGARMIERLVKPPCFSDGMETHNFRHNKRKSCDLNGVKPRAGAGRGASIRRDTFNAGGDTYASGTRNWIATDSEQ